MVLTYLPLLGLVSKNSNGKRLSKITITGKENL